MCQLLDINNHSDKYIITIIYMVQHKQNFHCFIISKLLKSESESESCSVMSDSLRPHGLWLIRLLCPRDSPGKQTGVCCHALLQVIFLTHGSNLGLLHCRQILYLVKIISAFFYISRSYMDMGKDIKNCLNDLFFKHVSYIRNDPLLTISHIW